jgi:putative membrane protein insertion efficiency factor
MGHRHTPEEFGGARGVCGADGGFVAGVEESAERESVEKLSVAPLRVRVALLALRFYKAYLSILFAGSCRFEPTCSQYAYEAIERFGVARGVWLGVKRLLRCQPLSRKFGYDPVPEKKENMGLEMNSAASAGRSSRAATEVHS